MSAVWPIAVGFLLSGIGYILFIFSHGDLGRSYWRYDFTGLIIGSGSTMASFLAIK